MKTIEKEVSNTLEIQKSKFITFLFPTDTQEECNQILIKIKNQYKDATHHCYAYILDVTQKASDDKEPSGTAGIPILEVLKKKELSHILCIVIRYFGGIKLGAGGLVRAYSNSVKEALELATIINLTDGYQITLSIPYEKQKELDYELKNITYQKSYGNEVTYTIQCTLDTYQVLKQKYVISKVKPMKIKEGIE